MAGSQDVGSNQQYSPSGQFMGGSMNYGGTTFNMSDPGQYSASQLNAPAANYVNNNSNLYGQLSGASLNPFNTGMYDQMRSTQQSQMDTSLQNHYAAMGLSGSSAEMGGIANADIQNNLQMNQQQMGAQLQYTNALSGLNQQGFNQTMGIQNQYGEFQDAYNQSLAGLLGVQQSANASQNAMWGQMVGGVAQGGGTAAGMAMMG